MTWQEHEPIGVKEEKLIGCVNDAMEFICRGQIIHQIHSRRDVFALTNRSFFFMLLSRKYLWHSCAAVANPQGGLRHAGREVDERCEGWRIEEWTSQARARSHAQSRKQETETKRLLTY